MPNPFDQFDSTAATPQATQGANPFDQFDGADMGRNTSALQGFNSTVPFGNRMTAGMGALIAAPFSDDSVSDLYDQARGNQKATETAHPGANLSGSLAGLGVTLPAALITGGENTLPVIRNLANVAQGTNAMLGNFVRGSALAPDAGGIAKLGKAIGTAARSSAVAAPVGAIYGAGAGDEGDRINSALEGARMGAITGGTLPIAGSALGAGSKAVGGVANRIGSLFGSETAQGNIADNILARRLVTEGYTPEEVSNLISSGQASNLAPTLGESTGSSGVLQTEKSVMRGTGAGANQMRDALFTRNREAVPNAINNFANQLQGQAGDISGAYKAAETEAAPNMNTFIDKAPDIHNAADEYANLTDLRNHLLGQIQEKTDLMGKQSGFWKRQTINETADIARNLDNVNKQITAQKNLIGSIDDSQFNNQNPLIVDTLNGISNDINSRLSKLGAGTPNEVSNVESATLKKALPIINNAQNQGATFNALHDAQKQLSNIYIENAQPGIQNTINSHTQNYRSQISGLLTDLAPQNFPTANKAAMTNMAAQELREAVNGTNGGSLKTLYNKVWASPELQADFLRKLPDDATRQQATNLFTHLENISRGFGGSDTAFNIPANHNLEREAGTGIDAKALDVFQAPQAAAESIGRMMSRGVYRKIAEQSLNPDAGRLTKAMQRVGGKSLLPNPTPLDAAASVLKGQEPQQIPAPTQPQNIQVPQAPAAALPPQSDSQQPQPQQQSQASPQNDLFSRVIQTESGGNQAAVSPKGAIGVAQIMPGTAREAAEAAGLPYDPFRLRTDSQYNAALGKAYLGKLQNKYGGNPALALMAYNWGQGNVDIWLRSGAKIDRIPTETKNYLTKILA